MAAVLRAGCRAHETAARYGGEEFAVLLPATGPVVARGVAERLRLAIERRDWPHGPVTASFGVATMTARTSAPGNLVEEADLALYQSKHKGRNQVTHSLDVGDRPEVRSWNIPEVEGSAPDLADQAAKVSWDDAGITSPRDRAGVKLTEAYDDIVDSLSIALNLRDDETSGHSRRVTALTMKMARSLDFRAVSY